MKKHSLKDWMIAVRPWSFPASSMPVVVTLAYLYWMQQDINWVNGIWALLNIVVFHAAGNTWSDYFDYKHKVDARDTFGAKTLTDGMFAPREIYGLSMALLAVALVAGIGLLWRTGFLNMFDHAGNAFVSAYRYYKDKECRTVDVHIEYIATPDLSKKTLLIVDPMLATGESMELAWKAFVTKGMPAKLQIACVIASQQGVEHLEKLFPGDEVTLWCAAIDPEMNEHSYIVPGLGDAGDLAFGDKI